MAEGKTRTLPLTPELETLIAGRLASGAHADAGAVVRAALLAMPADGAGASRPVMAGWPLGGGECGALVRARDWSTSALGPVEGWSAELRATVANVVNSPVAKVLMWGPDHIMIYNDRYIEIAGDRHPHALGASVHAIWPEISEFNAGVLAAGFRGERPSFIDQPLTLRRGGVDQEIVFDLFYTPVHTADGHIGGVLCTCTDNTRRIAAERRLAASMTELRTITDALPVLISFIDRDHVYRFANSQYEDWFGTPREAMIGRHVRDVIGAAPYADRIEGMNRALAGETVTVDTSLPHRDGTARRVEIRYLPRIETDGTIPGITVLATDVEERSRREAALAASNARFRLAMDVVHGVLWTNDADGRMTGEQPGWAALTGQSFDDYQDHGWTRAVHPDDADATVAAWHRALATRSMFVFEHRVRRHCGTWRTFAVRALPLLDEAGVIAEWIGVHTDITHQRAAEASLRELNETLEARVIAEIDERRLAEAKLAQAHKMETVGKLTGGVAHDFNNLLQVVSGNLQLLSKDIAGNERAERRVANALAGVSRGAKLAAQLLAFGRRQALEPKVVNVTRFVTGMDDMLRRAIGEGIEIETVFGGGLWNTFIDPGQIENAILNLAINARDAMDGHGRLTIELANAHLDDTYARTHEEVAPGQYVMLAVTDTGSGMAPEIVDRVFEPFFSTKGEGKGSGLGLSMVYGFVKQSGGHVKIYSEVGHGTTIRLYLPRAAQAEDVEVAVETGPIAGGTETVLVVEDDAAVRATVVEMLGDLGYRVLKAVDAQSALNVIESGIPIDLLFTDVVMPGTLKSPELARKTKERLPDIAVLFTSGYTENSIVHGGRLDAGVELLSKPYTREALARKFRHVLANQRQRSIAGTRAAAGRVTPPVALASAPRTILLVEDDAMIRANTAELLQTEGHVVVDAGSAEEAMAALQTAPVDILVTDVNLPGASGRELAARTRALRPDAAIVYATGDSASVAGERGAVILTKPYTAATLRRAIASAGGATPLVRGGMLAAEPD